MRWRNKKGAEDRREPLDILAAEGQGEEPFFEEPKPAEQVEEELEAYLNSPGQGEKQGKGPTKRWKGLRSWSRKKKRNAAILAAAAVAFLLFRAMAGGKQTAIQAPSTLLTKGDVTASLSLTGPVAGTESADVVSNLHAEVLEIRVKEGDPVEKGQILAVLDRADAQKEVDIAQNSYDLAVSEYNENIRDTENGYEKAVQDYDTAKLNYDRNQVLFDAGSISSAEFESVNNALQDARRAVEGYTVENGRAVPDKSYELKVRSAQFELEQKKKELDDTEVKSPISGTVVRVNSKVGQFADKPEDEKPMFIVENLSSLEMEIPVSEYSVGKVSVGQKASISADILDGRTVEGTVVSISPTGEEKAGSGSTERVVPTTISIDDPEQGLMAGITARATIVTEEAKGVFKVPTSALIRLDEQNAQIAVMAPDQTVRLIQVTTGVESDLETEIAPQEGETLEEGMTVFLTPAGLAEGMEVVPV